MSRKSIGERRTEKLAQIEELRRELVQLDAKAAERIGKLAVKAGLADLDLDDEALTRELQALAARFRPGKASTAKATAHSDHPAGATDGKASDRHA